VSATELLHFQDSEVQVLAVQIGDLQLDAISPTRPS
jgi:hypothetical protein